RLFARRHRGLVAAFSAVFLVLVAGVIVSSIGFMRAAKERDRAQTVNRYLQKLVGATAPGILGREASAPELLEFYARDIESAFADDPLTRAELHSIIGWTYFGLGHFSKAEEHLRSALSLHETELGEGTRETTDTRTQLATVLINLDRIAEAEALNQRSLAVSAEQLGEEHPSVLAAREVQASLTHTGGDLELAERQFRELIESSRTVLGADADLTLSAIGHLSVLLLDLMKYEEALPLLEEALAVQKGRLKEDHPSVLTLRVNLAQALEGLGRPQEADALLAAVTTAGERVWGPEHKTLLTAQSNRASLLRSMGRLDEALPLSEKVLAARTRLLGETHEETLATLSNHCSLLLSLGKAEEALPYGRRAADLLEQIRGPDHPHTWTARLNLASALHDVGRLDEALALMQDVARRRRQALGDDHPSTLILENNLGMLLLDLGRAQEATDLLRHALECTLASGVESGQALVLFHRNLGRCLLALGKYEDAEELLLESHRLAGLESGNVEALQQRSAEFLVELYEKWGRPEEAAKWQPTASDH
ncbi:MAG: tetratricopeptide repeat protein, partial [Planctomycetota bacterium]